MADRTGSPAQDDERLRMLLNGLRAVRAGDFGIRLPQVGDELLDEIATVFNGMADQLALFTEEVTRVAREVGTEGKLGGQATIPDVSGTWRELTESVNAMAGNLTAQVRSIAQVATAVARGDLSQKITVDARGEIQQLKSTINTMVDQLSSFADEVTRVAREVGTDGRLGGQARVPGVGGTWRDLTTSVNVMADNLTDQVRSIAQVATAVARGDLSQRITVEAKGEVAALAQTINTMVDTLSAFADEVTRVAREVGTEGILGGQARVANVAGTWKDLTDNVNSMANNLTGQVRSIAQVTTAVARGDLSQKIDVTARGEILELKTTINTMVDTLSAFAAEVTRVAREVGKEGRLGGQAEVEGVSGTWKRLTENVNELAGNLTRQVRAIAGVTSAVATGDLTRSISVEAQGEVAELKDNINAMVHSLRETTRSNEEQDWRNSNLARISGLLQGHRDLRAVAQLILDELTPLVGAQYGSFFLKEPSEQGEWLRLIASYGRPESVAVAREFELGQSLVGQVASTRRPIVVERTPPDYLISSSLGSATPVNLIVLPVVFEDTVLGVLELASFASFTPVQQEFLGQLMESIGVNVNTIIANGRTDSLLDESQRLAAELRARSDELQAQQVKLRQSNAELAEKAELLARQNRDIEVKNVEIEQARREIEERAQQLALTSKYKSEFLANMSHELRTPLTSLLILAGVLAQNTNQNLTPKQVEFAKVIESAGSDLLQLINDILDLSKVEAGKMGIHAEPVPLPQLLDYVRTTFQPLTAEKGLAFDVTAEPGVPEEIDTDEQRLRQVLRNLLSNAVKFTEYGGVELRVSPDAADPGPGSGDGQWVSFSVSDTGIGIAEENLEAIFGAFQQADGTTSRRYGGTGLGLSICRQVANLLGGELRATSTLGEGSTFTLYLPVVPPAEPEVMEPVPLREPEADRRVLVVEDSDDQLLELLVRGFATDLADAGPPVRIDSVATPDEAMETLSAHAYRCVVLDTSMSGASALTLLQRLARQDSHVPVLAHAAREPGSARERLLSVHAREHDVELLPSVEDLRDRLTTLLAGAAVEQLPEPENGPEPGSLIGRKVLLIDDDARNVLAIAEMLKLHGMTVGHAPNGRKGIEALRSSPDIDVILMDVMMPEMDGYATTAAIRRMSRFRHLPIIMLTAKAMAGDRENCLASGASDYITKPVDTRELLSCIRRWLTQE